MPHIEEVARQTHPGKAPLHVARTPPESNVPAQLSSSQAIEAGQVGGALEVEVEVEGFGGGDVVEVVKVVSVICGGGVVEVEVACVGTVEVDSVVGGNTLLVVVVDAVVDAVVDVVVDVDAVAVHPGASPGKSS